MANITLKAQAGVWFFAEKLIINKATSIIHHKALHVH